MPYDTLGRLLTLCIGMGWSITAWASNGVELTGLPWMGMALALWGGLASTSQRLVAAARAGAEPVAVWRSVLADILASSGAGFLVYGIGVWRAWDSALVSVLLFIAGYAGTRLLEPAVNVMVERMMELAKLLQGRQ